MLYWSVMSDIFTADFFVANRRRLRARVEAQLPIVVMAHGRMQRSSDAAYAFQQDSSFWYLTGIEHPDVILVMDNGAEYLIVPEREAIMEFFDGAVSHEKLTEQTGVATIYGSHDGWERLGKRLKLSSAYATLMPNPAYLEHHAMYTNPARTALIQKVKIHNTDIEAVDIRMDVARLRMIKQAPELTALQTAIDITIDSLLDATTSEKRAAYSHEYQLDAEIARGFRYRGARGHAFDPIVASGASAATIHSVLNNSPLHVGDLAVLDVGAEYQHYCADITRTISLNSKPTARQKAVYAAVRDVQNYAYSIVKPGMLIKQHEAAVENYMGTQLRRLKLIKTLDHDAIRTYYPHACSHFLGIDPHDAGDYAQPLEAGVVITVEPGIYIPEEGIGVRLEDDVLLTKTGHKILSSRLPTSLT